MDLSTVDWSRVCSAVAYSGGIRVCTLAPHPDTVEHFWTPASQVPDQLTPCQASTVRDGVVYVCALYGQHYRRDHEWVRPSELRPRQIDRAHPNRPGPDSPPVAHPTPERPLCLAPDPAGTGMLCGLPPDHALSGHGHYYVRLGGPGPGAGPDGGWARPGGESPASQPLGRPSTRPRGEYDSTRDLEPQPRPGPRTPGGGTAGGTGEGSGMANADELIAAIDGAIEQIREQSMTSVRGAINTLDETVERVRNLAGSGQVAAVHRALAGLQESAQHLEDSFRPMEAAIEHLAAWSAAIQQTHG